MSKFTKVLMVPGQTEIAKVNRKTGVLLLSDQIWKNLSPEEKSFVLFHEQGHLELQTADEFQANKYAVGKFLNTGTFTNKQLGQRIMVMRSALDKADGVTSSFTAELAAGALGAVFQNLQVLGIGSKSRIKEAQATASAATSVFEAQAKAEAEKTKGQTKIIVIIMVMLIVAISTYFILQKK